MKRALLVLIVFAQATICQAQVPGYQGKRFGIGYNINAFPALNFGLLSPVRLTTKHELYARFALSRKVTAGFSFLFAKQHLRFESGDFTSGNTEIDFEPDKVLNPCKLHVFDAYLQFSGRNFIAPVGIYHQLGFGLVKYNIATPVLKGTGNYNISSSVNKPADDFMARRVSYSIGRTNVITGKLLINTAIGANLYLGEGFSILGEQVSGSRNTPETYLRNNMTRGIFWCNLLDIKLGVSYLIF